MDQKSYFVVVAAAAAVVAGAGPEVPAVGSGWKLSPRSKQNNKLIT